LIHAHWGTSEYIEATMMPNYPQWAAATRKMLRDLTNAIPSLDTQWIFCKRECLRCPLAEQHLSVSGHRDKVIYREKNHFLAYRELFWFKSPYLTIKTVTVFYS